MFALLILQANTGVLTDYRRDATVRSVGVGWRELAAGIEAVRVRVGAACVLAPDYGTTGWLAFYLPKGTCVVQPSQRIRWVNMPEPDPALLAGKLLYVGDAKGEESYPKARFARVERVAELKRMRGPMSSSCLRAPGARFSTVRRRPSCNRSWALPRRVKGGGMEPNGSAAQHLP
jgi:hypothetical protein